MKRSLVLWFKAKDPPSERARLTLQSVKKIVPSGVDVVSKSIADCEDPPVLRVPSLLFQINGNVAYVIEGEFTLDDVRAAFQRLSNG